MRPEDAIRMTRANPGRSVLLDILDSRGMRHRVRLRWEEGGVRFYIPAWRHWERPMSEPQALEVMELWRLLGARVEEVENV
jgi:hypothetical protein